MGIISHLGQILYFKSKHIMYRRLKGCVFLCNLILCQCLSCMCEVNFRSIPLVILTSEVLLLLGKEQEVIKTGSGLCVAITLPHKLNLLF